MAPSLVVEAAAGVTVAAGMTSARVGDQLNVGVAREMMIVADCVPTAKPDVETAVAMIEQDPAALNVTFGSAGVASAQPVPPLLDTA
jgi:hypothetical protein